jgi:hypothetical protein
MSFRDFGALLRGLVVSMDGTCTVFVPLVGEGIEVWRPANAVRVGPELFRLMGPVPEGETWEFNPGEVVQCAMRVFFGGKQRLTAFQRAGAEPDAANRPPD